MAHDLLERFLLTPTRSYAGRAAPVYTRFKTVMSQVEVRQMLPLTVAGAPGSRI